MTPDEFSVAAQSIVGQGHGWRKKISVPLGVSLSTVSRYASGELPVPHTVELALRQIDYERRRDDLL